MPSVHAAVPSCLRSLMVRKAACTLCVFFRDLFVCPVLACDFTPAIFSVQSVNTSLFTGISLHTRSTQRAREFSARTTAHLLFSSARAQPTLRNNGIFGFTHARNSIGAAAVRARGMQGIHARSRRSGLLWLDGTDILRARLFPPQGALLQPRWRLAATAGLQI